MKFEKSPTKLLKYQEYSNIYVIIQLVKHTQKTDVTQVWFICLLYGSVTLKDKILNEVFTKLFKISNQCNLIKSHAKIYLFFIKVEWLLLIKPIRCQCCSHSETSQSICTANQLTGFSIDWFLYEGKLTFNGLTLKSLLFLINMEKFSRPDERLHNKW